MSVAWQPQIDPDIDPQIIIADILDRTPPPQPIEKEYYERIKNLQAAREQLPFEVVDEDIWRDELTTTGELVRYVGWLLDQIKRRDYLLHYVWSQAWVRDVKKENEELRAKVEALEAEIKELESQKKTA